MFLLLARVMLCFCSDIFHWSCYNAYCAGPDPFVRLHWALSGQRKIQTKFLDHQLIHVLV
ncbi:hypothetical protein PVAP13_9KG250713 [Panicum virgatum]|uniref:Uncharacterized protein n=1 Tax=Panicum virgatum TaxID=38727 RepID=A0A8T0NMF0_PANVG|nr:hypothetical protein PVAP13_9KG250713 [Panicum virgatum]